MTNCWSSWIKNFAKFLQFEKSDDIIPKDRNNLDKSIELELDILYWKYTAPMLNGTISSQGFFLYWLPNESLLHHLQLKM